MAQRAIVLYTNELIDINSSGEITFNTVVHYGDSNANPKVTQVTVVVGPIWPGLTMATFNQEVRNRAIAEQPDGFSLTNADILLPTYQKGSLL